ncbi:Tol-like protein [Lasiodiplodia theobromae]|uniref:Tol-like protein n=1 Tax=Lasiodiplodia theobromae TaxID=45133 RepID=UPI0015C36F5D|nr:Tol-like protein [Lasiodiplodia theobromae]KAF4546314.1 Tol-like protein [Lasiodiplodia theobromae]
MKQILQMDYIYKQADLTIVAAAGDHSDYGLPGVSTVPRSPRQSLKIGNYVLMSCWRDTTLAHALEQSKWMERAWTYQEALLSERRLFFTDYCYLHDCGKCFAEGDESVQFDSWRHCPKRVAHGHAKLTSQWMAYHAFPSATDMCKRIEEYSRRHLSHQSDALNAITGVLQTYEHTVSPEQHYFGLPMFRPYVREADPSTTNMDGFVQSMRWSLEGSQVRERRPEFPSWSWVGWKCPCYMKSEAPTTPTEVIIEIELSSGARIDWAQFAEMGYLKHDRTSQSRYIWVEAWTFLLETLDAPPPFEENVQQSELIRNAIIDPNVVQFKASIDLFCNDSAEELERLRVSCGKGRLLAVVLGDISKEVTTRSIIIVEELDGEYQRVGNFDDTGRAMIWDISASFWERDIAGLERQWIRLS